MKLKCEHDHYAEDVTSVEDASATSSHHQTGEEDSGESVHTAEKGTPATDSQDDDKPESDHGLNEEMTYIDEVEEETEPTEDSLPNTKQKTKDSGLISAFFSICKILLD